MGMHVLDTHPPAPAGRVAWAEANGTRGVFRFGRLPTTRDYCGYLCSRNHRDGGLEDGVSAYEGWLVGDTLVLDLRRVDAVSALFIIDADDVYQLRGAMLVARGGDGEPLLVDDGDQQILTATRVTVSSVVSVLT